VRVSSLCLRSTTHSSFLETRQPAQMFRNSSFQPSKRSLVVLLLCWSRVYLLCCLYVTLLLRRFSQSTAWTGQLMLTLN